DYRIFAARLSPAWIIVPHSVFTPAEALELGLPERRFRDREELIELRRRDGRSGEHRMGLASMVGLMLKKMHQQAVAPFGLHPRLAIDPHDAVEQLWRQCIAHRDQAAVDRRLCGFQFRNRRTGDFVLPGLWSEPAT